MKAELDCRARLVLHVQFERLEMNAVAQEIDVRRLIRSAFPLSRFVDELKSAGYHRVEPSNGTESDIVRWQLDQSELSMRRLVRLLFCPSLQTAGMIPGQRMRHVKAELTTAAFASKLARLRCEVWLQFDPHVEDQQWEALIWADC